MENNQKYIIIALAVVILALAAGIGYMLMNHGVEYQTISLSNGTTMEVPKADDANFTVNEYGIKMYTATSKKTSVMSFNSEENFNLVGAAGFALARDAFINGSSSVETYNGYDVRENTVNGTHYFVVYISNNQTHDNIFMGCCDLDILKHMIDSISFGQPAKAVKNATSESEPVVVNNNASTNDKNKYSQDDLARATQEGYYNGYVDGLDDSYLDDYYDDYEDYSSSSSSSSSSDSGSSDVETTADSSSEPYVDEDGNLV